MLNLRTCGCHKLKPILPSPRYIKGDHIDSTDGLPDVEHKLFMRIFTIDVVSSSAHEGTFVFGGVLFISVCVHTLPFMCTYFVVE